jgi:hypothetical protein
MYLRELKKPVAYKFGDLVIVLNPHIDNTILVRRKRSQKAVRVSLRELLAAGDGIRAPQGWIPEVGQEVAVLPNRHRATVLLVIDMVGGPYVKIRYKKGRERIVEKAKLVPVGDGAVLVECERVPRCDKSL